MIRKTTWNKQIKRCMYLKAVPRTKRYTMV